MYQIGFFCNFGKKFTGIFLGRLGFFNGATANISFWILDVIGSNDMAKMERYPTGQLKPAGSESSVQRSRVVRVDPKDTLGSVGTTIPVAARHHKRLQPVGAAISDRAGPR